MSCHVMSCLLPLNKIGSCAHSAIRINRILIHADDLYHGTQFISLAVGKDSNSKQLKYFVALYQHAASLSYFNCGMLQVTNCSFSLNPSLLLYDLLLYTSTCMRWCVFRLLCLVNDLLHISHLNGRSPLCIWCVFRLLCLVNDLLHISHLNGRSPECPCWCVFR
jgi:hypothetical protein